MILIDLCITVIIFLIFPVIYVLTKGKVEKKKASKMSIINVIICAVIFAIVIGLEGGSEKDISKSFVPALFYYFISFKILVCKNKKIDKHNGNIDENKSIVSDSVVCKMIKQEYNFIVNSKNDIAKNIFAIIDYTIYYNFSQYALMCNLRNQQLVEKFMNEIQKNIIAFYKDKYEIAENILLKIFNDRIDKYDSIMQSCADKDGELIHAVTQFICDDIYQKKQFVDTIFIHPIDKVIDIKMQVSLLYQGISKLITPLYNDFVSVN